MLRTPRRLLPGSDALVQAITLGGGVLGQGFILGPPLPGTMLDLIRAGLEARQDKD